MLHDASLNSASNLVAVEPGQGTGVQVLENHGKSTSFSMDFIGKVWKSHEKSPSVRSLVSGKASQTSQTSALRGPPLVDTNLLLSPRTCLECLMVFMGFCSFSPHLSLNLWSALSQDSPCLL